MELNPACSELSARRNAIKEGAVRGSCVYGVVPCCVFQGQAELSGND